MTFEERVISENYSVFVANEPTPKGERITPHFTKCDTDLHDPNCHMGMWKAQGLITNAEHSYWSVRVEVADGQGVTEKYNPMVAPTMHPCFDWVLEATKENQDKILAEISRRAEGERKKTKAARFDLDR